MDVCVKESKLMSPPKRGDNLHKASSILSFAAILLTIALFVRMEKVVHDSKMMDSKFTLEIQQIKEDLKEEKASHQARVKENFDIVSGKLTFCCSHSLVILRDAINAKVMFALESHLRPCSSTFYVPGFSRLEQPS